MIRYMKQSDGTWAKQLNGVAPSKLPLPSAVLINSARRSAKVDLKFGAVPPNDGELEQAVLGCMLIEMDAVRIAKQILKPENFYYDAHKYVFEAMLDCSEKGIHPDVVLASAALRDSGKMDLVGGASVLATYLDRVSCADHVGHYAKKVLGLYLDREIIAACKRYSDGQRAEMLDALRKLHIEKESLDLPFLVEYANGVEKIVENIMKPDLSKVYQTHFPGIDKAWKGMKAGELNTWAAATNEGKSVVLLNLLDRAADSGQRVLYIGTEMEAVQTVERHLAMQSGIPAWKIRKPELDARDTDGLRSTAKAMARMKVFIFDDPEPNLAQIEAAIHSSKAEVVFLDYLERFEMPHAKELRLQIKMFMKSLKTMLRRTGAVGHLAAQLNRDVYGSDQRAPNLADLSESSAIEKESDRVMLMHTPIAPGSQRKGAAQPHANNPELPETHRFIQAVCAKNRHGARGMAFDLVLNQADLKVQELSEFKDPFRKKL